MSNQSIVYGCIKDTPKSLNSERQQVNRRAILALPLDDDWPFLSQSMFSLAHCDPGQSSAFQSPLIHFGAAYQAIEYEWSQWIMHFEALLSRMYWVSANVHLETELFGSHAFSWQVPDGGAPGKQPHCFKCGWVQEFVTS